MESTIHQYLKKRGPLFRTEDGTYIHRYDKVGVVVAISDGKNYAIGVSKVNLSPSLERPDVFNADLGYDIAMARAADGLHSGKTCVVPASQIETVMAFNERAAEFFKDQSLAHDLKSVLDDEGLTVTIEEGYRNQKPKVELQAD